MHGFAMRAFSVEYVTKDALTTKLPEIVSPGAL